MILVWLGLNYVGCDQSPQNEGLLVVKFPELQQILNLKMNPTIFLSR